MTFIAARRGFLIVQLVLIGMAVQERAVKASEPSKPRRLVFVDADLQIGTELPKGWSHLVIRSIPRLGSGDVDTLPGVAAETATLFHSLILVDVRRVSGDDSTHELARVGLALCVPLNGVDTVVRATGTCATRDTLGFVERQVVPRAEEEMARARVTAKTATMVVFGAPTMFKVGEAHEDVRLYYAILVDPETGDPHTFHWIRPLDENSDKAKAFSEVPVRLLTPALKVDCPLDVVAHRLLGTIPLNWSFAMTRLPQGRKIPLSNPISAWASEPKRIQNDPEAFEALLKEFLASKTSDVR